MVAASPSGGAENCRRDLARNLKTFTEVCRLQLIGCPVTSAPLRRQRIANVKPQSELTVVMVEGDIRVTKHYDLVVIGTGTGASGAASRCRSAGWSVAIIDYLPFGGTCALRGCDPKKVLVGATEAVDHSRRMRGHGVAGGEPTIAWSELIEFKRNFTEPVPPMKEKNFAKNGIDAYHGRAKFLGPNSISVGGDALEGRFILIAVGAVPMRLGIPGEEHVITSTESYNAVWFAGSEPCLVRGRRFASCAFSPQFWPVRSKPHALKRCRAPPRPPTSRVTAQGPSADFTSTPRLARSRRLLRQA